MTYHLSDLYRAHGALRQLNFEIPRGLVTVIVGESGAGKTTILNLLLRLTEPTAGSIEIDAVPSSSSRQSALLAAASCSYRTGHRPADVASILE